MVNVKFDFDPKKLQKQVEDAAKKAYFEAIERARRSLGADAHLVKFTPLATPRRHGSNLTFGDMSFPSDDVRRRFEEALKRELR